MLLEKKYNQQRLQRGQGMIEYGLIIALVAVVVIASLVLLGPIILRDLNSALQAI